MKSSRVHQNPVLSRVQPGQVVARVQPGVLVSRRRFATAGIGAVAFAILGISFLAPRVMPAQAGGGATQAQTAAISAKLQGGIAILKTATVIVSAGKGPAAVGKADFDARSKALPRMLAAFYTGEPLSRFTDLLQGALNNERDRDTRDVGGGSRQLEITSLTVSGSVTHGTARSLDWLQDASQSTGEVNPEMSGWWSYTFHMVHTSNGWRIDALEFEPEPGSEP